MQNYEKSDLTPDNNAVFRSILNTNET